MSILTSWSAFAQTLPDLPATIKPGDLKPYFSVAAKGAQIYVCGKNANGAAAWMLKGPEAELFDNSGKTVGKHYVGPTWEGLDGDKVVGAVKSSADAPDANAISWLLLDIKSREGKGRFTEAVGILRIMTVGGKPPASGCDEARAGAEQRVPYAAMYVFLK
ncbi:MAG TPA: DUF3455 domain-containing protein [Xanthobacteraceae bacterium]|jgi:hypothetical protein|nr:DUF3455 domain-containing protein [Xanthobacteraceae bacterium]